MSDETGGIFEPGGPLGERDSDPTIDEAVALLREMSSALLHFYSPDKELPPHVAAVERVVSDLHNLDVGQHADYTHSRLPLPPPHVVIARAEKAERELKAEREEHENLAREARPYRGPLGP